ncbi:HAD family hydrolase [Mesorhizobium sp.]|uniref:HAD family hydrolase n=1 Tax=Mesorhizobium sp. TaxID=1871066 RepID=UPI000FE4D898|nr:HAD family hydrolase [Mesorhizobium sp.]RWK58045.1 MAG: hypothetical protein EOR49_33360 [Mesorhizobium sp.]RWM40748.1 MAG: hypothetical protein EOR76_35370 [Mesorhizobium sp.]
MRHIVERLSAKLKQADIAERACIEPTPDPDSCGEMIPRFPEEGFIARPSALPDEDHLVEKITDCPESRLLWSDMRDTHHNEQIAAETIPKVLDEFGDSLKVLSLDCFDTLLWRNTATPNDVFAVLADTPLARRLGITAHQRIRAATRARRAKSLENGSREVDLGDIYRSFTSLSSEERELLAESEIRTEMDVCFAFSPCVELIRLAHTRGIKIIVVSDTYLREDELRRLLDRHLPADAMQSISKVYCSVDYGTSKSEDLFQIVIKECGLPASQLLHIGDNDVADVQAPRKLGVRSLHFLQFNPQVAKFLRLQNAASSLVVLDQAAPEAVILPRYSPFRPVFSVAHLHPYGPETLIGYMSFGPALYAYARFLMDEVETLQLEGKRVKVFFLLRDAYLLSAACEAYAGKPVGKLIRMRKFHAIAASFKVRADIDYYLSDIEPGFDNLRATAKQLLLPPDVTELLVRAAHQSDDPKTAFHQLLHDEEVVTLIINNSLALRARLMRYISRELEVKEGDTIILADVGYSGRTQEYFSRTFKEEFNVDILGRYVFTSDDPYRAAHRKALVRAGWDNTTLFEQCCTVREGAVVDYEADGEPIFADIKLSERQYEKVANVQAECLRFIHDARTFFSKSGMTHEYPILQRAAHAALFRHAYMPVEAELEYFKDFQHDKFMGRDGKKTIYHLESARENVICVPSPHWLDPYETRSLGLDFTFSGLVQRRFRLDLSPEDMNVRFSPVMVSIGSTHESKVFLLRAHHLHDGYFSVMLPCVSCGTSVKMLLGQHYEWLQMADVQLLSSTRSVHRGASSSLDLEEIRRTGEIYQCLSPASVATIRTTDLQRFSAPHYYHVIFRPLVWRASGGQGAAR